MKVIKLIQNYLTNMLIIIVTLVSLFISFQITSNDYKDNRHYSKAYFLMNQHKINIHDNKEDMYYLVDSPKDSSCVENGYIKYYILDKKKYAVNDSKIIFSNNQYYLVSCNNRPEFNSGVIHEKAFYLQKDRTLPELLITNKTTVGGSEPIYLLLSYIGSSILEYDHFILLMNIVFLFVVFLALKKFTKNYKYMYILLISFDFYIYIYLSNTHRLKLAIIFLLLSYLTHNKTKMLMTASAILSHFQVLLIYLYYLTFSLIHNTRLDDILSKKKIYSFYILLLLTVGFFFLDHIIWKINYYLHIEIPYKVIVLILIYLIYLFIFKFKDTIKLFVPLAMITLVVAFLIGPDRINFMLMEFILIVELNRLLNRNKYALLVVVPFILYSTYKSINYIQIAIQ